MTHNDRSSPYIGDMEKFLPQKLQRHFHRNEQWVVVRGSGTIYLEDFPGGKETTVSDVHHIGVNQIHRLRGGEDGIMIVEVQYGDMCIEEDIERLEDDYGRV